MTARGPWPATPAAPRATLRRGGMQTTLVVLSLALLGYAAMRLVAMFDTPRAVTSICIAGLVAVAWDLVAGSANPTFTPRTQAERDTVDRLRVVALVPAYNEDDDALRACLASMLRQSRPLDDICVTDDGSTTGDYAATRDWFLAECVRHGVTGHWERVPNGGKRQAQVVGLRAAPHADVYLTVDSDTILDPEAVAQGVQPFADDRVQAVAGVVLTANYGENLLTRIQELAFTDAQLVTRSALSRMGSVQVTSGGLALYRAGVLQDNIDTYLSETCLGRPMHASDDSLLALFALQCGRVVQQSDAFAFTLMPTSLSHHRRQQLRWMRGSTVRSAWRFRYLPTRRYAFWQHLAKWALYAANTGVALTLLGTGVLTQLPVLAWTAVVVVAFNLLVATPYLALRRSDQTVVQRLGVFAVAPLVGLWQMTVLRVLRWYAMATFVKVTAGWGTRSQVEVTAGS
ncbi:hyaluronan synthase [Luteimicrobium subarcticum]|uniref:Hyaluronan synthase n=1 Tax=Luteimicrobium subarcticum TaxID=620910 RepID=A0A2M8W6K7_9MICO|nr:hyaluronan synthase [Luteimicrobium subarcticum]